MGTRTEVADRLTEYIEAGVRRFAFLPCTHGGTPAQTRILLEDVGPQVR